MKIGITISLDNYESIRIDTSDHDDEQDCIAELNWLLRKTAKVLEDRESNIAFWIEKYKNYLCG